MNTADHGDAEWLATAQAQGGQHWVANAACRVESLDWAGVSQPVTLLGAQPDRATIDNGSRPRNHTSYTLSPRSAWLRYAVHEGRRMLDAQPARAWRALRPALPLLTALPTGLLLAAGMERVAVLANRLTSTNLHPQHPPADWAELMQLSTRQATQRYADRPLLMRNVCAAVNPGLPQALTGAGWLLIPARQVWLCDPSEPAVWKRNNVRNDKRLVHRPEVQWVSAHELSAPDLPALRACFQAVFHDKHSQLNPDFTPAYFELCRRSGQLELLALRHAGEWVGVMGLDARHGWLTTPLLGYDTQRPQALALYRRLMGRLLQEARDRGLKLHYSSGADAFKAARGGTPALEYTALHLRHLPLHQRLAGLAFARLMQAAVPRALPQIEQTQTG